MKKKSLERFLPAGLIVMALMVTGCPHNDYTVELKPQGKSIERTLTFYRVDNTNDENFDPAELAAITALYPTNAGASLGKHYVVRGSFGSRLPDDVGGTGTYTNLSTSMGEAGFYAEKFRGSDDLAAMFNRRFHAADDLADLFVGWSKAQLGSEPGYGQLHQFLDVNFRNDLKNASTYMWEGETVNTYQTNASEEFKVRFVQYLMDHGYFKFDELPGLIQDFSSDDSKGVPRHFQRLVARKMGIPDACPIPASLNFLEDSSMMEQSFTNYIVSTPWYHSRLEEWEKDKKSNPDAKRLNPEDVMQEDFMQLFGITVFADTPDHLTVRLALPAPPLHSNGQWDETAKAVVWSSDIEGRTNLDHLPVSCYASWANPAEGFQKIHFGQVVLTGDGLALYCIWHATLDAQHSGEWNDFLAQLKPGDGLIAKLDAFRFWDEKEAATNGVMSFKFSSKDAREMIEGGLKE